LAISKIQSTYVATRNMEASTTFYQQALGLRLKFRDGDRWAQFDVGGANFALSSPAEAADGAQGAVVVFETEDLAAQTNAVLAAGGTLVGERDMGSHGRVATFSDPQGSRFQVFARTNDSTPT
jgi:predicted enzyme related to lactoylglutathione lyase